MGNLVVEVVHPSLAVHMDLNLDHNNSVAIMDHLLQLDPTMCSHCLDSPDDLDLLDQVNQTDILPMVVLRILVVQALLDFLATAIQLVVEVMPEASLVNEDILAAMVLVLFPTMCSHCLGYLDVTPL